MNGISVTLEQAMEEYTLQTLQALKTGKDSVPEVQYV